VRRFSDISNVWNTIREINVGEIQEEAEQPVTLLLIGDSGVRAPVARALRGVPGRFPAAGLGALLEYDLPLPREQQADLHQATLIVLALDGSLPLPPDIEGMVDRLSMVSAPSVVVCLGADRLPRTADGEEADLGGMPIIFVAERAQEKIAEKLLPEIVERIPTEQRVAAARRLPGLRGVVAREIIGDTAFSNATNALTSGIPELIPLLNVPLNAADILVLTKNQALMVYRLGLAFGASGDFQAQMREILPVIGGGFVWRQVARQLVGLVPGFGLLPKVAVAYAGTYAAGQAAALWYSRGEVLSRAALGRLYKQAMVLGRQRAAELLARRRRGDGYTGETRPLAPPKRGLRRFLPGRKEPPSPPQT